MSFQQKKGTWVTGRKEQERRTISYEWTGVDRKPSSEDFSVVRCFVLEA